MGLAASIIDQNFPPKAVWDTSDIPDLTSKVMIVTGGNIGLGYETAKELLNHNAKVYITCRNLEKAESAVRALQAETQKTAEFLVLDLSSLVSVKAAADEFNRRERELHVLFNNAGVMASPISDLTKEGYDLQFGVNVLGHFYLSNLLLPSLKAAATNSPDHVARVINVSSQTHVLGRIDFDTLTDTQARRKLGPDGLYNQSKFGNVVFSQEFARRYGDDGIMSVALHPGSLTTNLGRHINPIIRRIIHFLSHTPAQGALTQLYGGTAPEAASMNGKYLIPWARVGTPEPATQDSGIGKKLWEWLELQVSS